MNRNLGIERVFSLGQYKTLRVTDEIVNLPEELTLNSKFVDQVRLLQMVSVDLVFQKYFALMERTAEYHNGSDEVIGALKEIRANVMDDLQKLLDNKE